MNDSRPAISADRLCKSYQGRPAVVDCSFEVPRGEVFGFLGPNGAGKTTSIKMLLGLVFPDAGGGRLLGLPLGNPESRRRVGFLPEHFRFHEWLRAREFLEVHAGFFGIDRQTARQQAGRLLERVGLAEHAEKPLRAFSKGMLQRIGLAQALVNGPELVILDEPASGLDPLGRLLVRDLIRELAAAGTTIFLNSHLLSEVEVTCQRAAFIKQGRIVRTGKLEELACARTLLDLTVRPLPAQARDGLLRWGKIYSEQGDQLTLQIEKPEDIPDINCFLVDQGLRVYRLQPRVQPLEETFIEIIGREELA